MGNIFPEIAVNEKKYRLGLRLILRPDDREDNKFSTKNYLSTLTFGSQLGVDLVFIFPTKIFY